MITYKEDIPLKLSSVLKLYKSVNWTAYTSDGNKEKLMTAIENSDYIVTAWNDSELIGLARALSDDVSIFYLQDILVKPEFQRQGIGRELLKRCLERYSHVRTKILLTDDREEQRKFYTSLGFKNLYELKKHKLNVYLKMNNIDLK